MMPTILCHSLNVVGHCSQAFRVFFFFSKTKVQHWLNTVRLERQQIFNRHYHMPTTTNSDGSVGFASCVSTREQQEMQLGAFASYSQWQAGMSTPEQWCESKLAQMLWTWPELHPDPHRVNLNQESADTVLPLSRLGSDTRTSSTTWAEVERF